MANPQIKLIAGLGNPGPEHEHTPHNAGFWFIDELARQFNGQLKQESRFHGEACKVRIGQYECWLLKPMTYMNHSGQAVNALAKYYRIDQSEVVVAHDELDFEPGMVKLKKGGGHGGHNGLRDIMPSLGKDFYRLRLGVGHPGDRNRVTGYLLGRASRQVREGVDEAIAEVMRHIELLISGDIERFMQALHTD